MSHWYEAKMGNHLGLIVDEKTGANIAVAYDKANAPLIAAAPDLLDALAVALVTIEAQCDPSNVAIPMIRAAITKATGGAV